jgi:hypothetical protein
LGKSYLREVKHMNVKLTKMMATIQKMVVLADHPNTSPIEAATFRSKVEQLMRQYRIEEEDLIAQDATAVEPILHTFKVSDYDNARQYDYANIGYAVGHHAGVRVVTQYKDDGVYLNFIGYEGDVRAAEMLYTAARLVFSDKIDPQYDPLQSDQLNAYRLRASGMLRKDIAKLLFDENTPRNRARVSSLYKAECSRRGERPQLDGSFNARDFAQAYADGFQVELSHRLRAARDAADSVGGALVLHGRQDRIDEATYRHFPTLRPSNAPAEAERPKPLKARKVTKRQLQQEYRRFASPAARAGQGVGRDAAREIELTRPAPAGRIDS